MFFNSIFSSRIYCIYHGSGGPVILNRFCALSCPFSLLGHDLSQTAPMRGLSIRSTACYCLWYLKLCIMLTSGHCTHCDMSVALCTVWHKTFLVVHGDSGLSNTTLHLNDFLKRLPCFQSRVGEGHHWIIIALPWLLLLGLHFSLRWPLKTLMYLLNEWFFFKAFFFAAEETENQKSPIAYTGTYSRLDK